MTNYSSTYLWLIFISFFTFFVCTSSSKSDETQTSNTVTVSDSLTTDSTEVPSNDNFPKAYIKNLQDWVDFYTQKGFAVKEEQNFIFVETYESSNFLTTDFVKKKDFEKFYKPLLIASPTNKNKFINLISQGTIELV